MSAQKPSKPAGWSAKAAMMPLSDLLDQVLTEHPEMEFVQLQMNYLDWESAEVQSRKCYEVASKHGKPVIVMEPVKGGKLVNIPQAGIDLLKTQDEKMCNR